ncbi:MAG: hypothetical protein LBB23_02855 [Rickettsiales bacterium]|jgi:hypothetical protein|nr:hypothetical protein [Rickettsiales bacterium]
MQLSPSVLVNDFVNIAFKLPAWMFLMAADMKPERIGKDIFDGKTRSSRIGELAGIASASVLCLPALYAGAFVNCARRAYNALSQKSH